MSPVLDAEALIAVGRDDRATAAVIEAARQEHRLVIVPAGAVGQLWRGGGRQARLARLLNARGVVVEPLTGHRSSGPRVLCGSARPRDVVDASVVLAARRHRATVVGSDRAAREVLDPTIRLVDCRTIPPVAVVPQTERSTGQRAEGG